MSFKDLTVEQVRGELTKLIENYPSRKGGTYADDCDTPDDLSCVYYADSDGTPVSAATYDYVDSETATRLVTPICIVGEWVESFHPELKLDETFQLVLLQNSIIANSELAAEVFNDDVRKILATAQRQQDDGMCWGEIEL